MIGMKWFSILLLGCIVSTCFAEVLVQQDFEDPTFPPTGWTTYSGGYGFWGAVWTQAANGNNHFALGQCSVFASSSFGRAVLCTPYFFLSAGSVLSISFDGRWIPFSTAGILYLYDSKIGIWSGYIPDDGRFKKRTYTASPVPVSGNYRVGWESYCNTYTGAMGEMRIDNVLITTVQKSINGTETLSLGRIKSAYK